MESLTTLFDWVRDHRVAVMMGLFVGICYWAFLPSLRRRWRKK